jgi:hypothetical protein
LSLRGARSPASRLLRARRKRPSGCAAAEQRDESSFDHLVGELLEMQGHLEAKHSGRLQVDDESNLVGETERRASGRKNVRSAWLSHLENLSSRLQRS